MQRAIALAKENNIGCVTVKNTNHWMRGGTYGWQAADAECIGICITNAIATMPPWGGIKPRLGNNPLVIAVPRTEGHVVLDMTQLIILHTRAQLHHVSICRRNMGCSFCLLTVTKNILDTTATRN